MIKHGEFIESLSSILIHNHFEAAIDFFANTNFFKMGYKYHYVYFSNLGVYNVKTLTPVILFTTVFLNLICDLFAKCNIYRSTCTD